jgi:hypothetical protein
MNKKVTTYIPETLPVEAHPQGETRSAPGIKPATIPRPPKK